MGRLVSLLATDIVGSTQLWAHHEDAMRDDLATHDGLVRSVITGAGGEVFKHTGDGVLSAFDDPLLAVIAAAAVQRAISAASWRVADGIHVRAAVHTGLVHERDGDLYGPTVNRAARLLGLCPSGAVVVSGTTAGLLADRVVADMTVRAIGPVHLRGLDEPDVAHVLDAPHLTYVTELVVGRRIVGRPPPTDGALVGRHDELTAVVQALRTHSLVSIIGVGGMGKTRLALEVCAATGDLYPDGALWCDLSTATSVDAVGPVTLEALNARRQPGRSAVDSIIEHLSGQRSLLVLDNCEHVLTGTIDLVRRLHESCPEMRLLLTSREALGLPSEWPIPLGPLRAADAVMLFLSRAAVARPDLEWGDEAAAEVDEICARLDRIPLAVELAAARTRVMAVGEIAARLDDRFRLLRGGRSSSERHQTLRSTVDWSYSMLDEAERHVFDHLAVFAGGGTIDAVSAVADIDEYEAFDVLDRLAARSLLLIIDTPLGTRYRQLETLRQYAEQRLAEGGATAEAFDRHLTWARDLAGDLALTLDTPTSLRSFRRYVAETDNFRLAVHHAATSGRLHEAWSIVADVATWATYRPTFDLVEWIDLLDGADAWPAERAEAAAGCAALSLLFGDSVRAGRLIDAIPAAHHGRAAVAVGRVFVEAWGRGDTLAARQALDAATESPLTTPSLRRAEMTLDNIALLGSAPSDQVVDIVERGRSTVAAARLNGDELALAFTLVVQSVIESNGGHPPAGRVLGLEAADIAERCGALLLVDLARANAAWARAISSRADSSGLIEARDTLLEAADRAHRFTVVNLIGAASKLLADDDPQTSLVLTCFVKRMHQRPIDAPASVDAWRRSADAAEITALEHRGSTLTLDDAVRLAVESLELAISAAGRDR